MAYPFFPVNYQPYYAPQNQPVQPFQTPAGVNAPQMQSAPQSANNGLVWVQGIEGAKAHVTAPGVPALLMDSESERFFIKTTDASGMPMPLRVFEYKEVTAETPAKAAPDMSGYVTRDEFEQFKQSFGKAVKLTDGEPTV